MTSPASGHIDPSAVVSKTATVCTGAWIGPAATIGPGAFIAPTAVVGLPRDPGAAYPVSIGEETWIGPGVLIEAGATIGDGCRIGHGCTIRQGAKLNQHVVLAERCTVAESAVLEDCVRVLCGAYICEFSILKRHCQVMPGVMLFNDPYPPAALDVRAPTLGECSVIGANAVIWPGVTLGYHAMAATFAEVRQDVPDYVLVRGQPAKPICDVRMIRMKLRGEWVYPYPWMRHQIPGENVRLAVAEAFERNREIQRRQDDNPDDAG